MNYFIAIVFFLQAFNASAKASDDVLAGYELFRDSIVAIKAAEDPRSQLLQVEFTALLKLTGVTTPVRLIVTKSSLIAQAFPGRVVAVNLEIAGVPKAQRTFIMAHELGHVLMDHFGSLLHVIDDQERALAVLGLADAIALNSLSLLSHSNEFSADTFASNCVLKLNLSVSDAIKFFEPFESQPESSSHPAVAERLRRLAFLDVVSFFR